MRKIIMRSLKWAEHQPQGGGDRRSKVFTRLIKDSRCGEARGGDHDINLVFEVRGQAREANMAKDSVQNAIKRGSGGLEGVSYEEARYEGYGPGGAAVLVACLTDNRTRTVAEVRHAFTKNGGNLGSDGSVAYLFKHCGQFVFAPAPRDRSWRQARCRRRGRGENGTDRSSLSRARDFGALKRRSSGPAANPTRRDHDEPQQKPSSRAARRRMRKLLPPPLGNRDDVQDVYTTAVLTDILGIEPGRSDGFGVSSELGKHLYVTAAA